MSRVLNVLNAAIIRSSKGSMEAVREVCETEEEEQLAQPVPSLLRFDD